MIVRDPFGFSSSGNDGGGGGGGGGDQKNNCYNSHNMSK
jgi:hypothetical protein